MSVVKDTTVAGSTIFVRVGKKRGKRQKGEKRNGRKKPTPEEIKKVNEKNAKKTLAILINYNFKPSDIHMALTYSGEEPTKEQAKKDLEKFKRDLSKLYRNKSILLKWITATEYEAKRIHHHMICTGGIDIIEIAKKWPHGFIRPAFLDKTGDYRKLAAYLIKETSKTFRDKTSISKRRYNCSRTMERPETKEEIVSSANLFGDSKPVRGYYIDPDSIYKGCNPITGEPYLEYVMISLTEEPRIRKWNRGKKKKHRNPLHKIYENKQLELPVHSLLLGEVEGLIR